MLVKYLITFALLQTKNNLSSLRLYLTNTKKLLLIIQVTSFQRS